MQAAELQGMGMRGEVPELPGGILPSSEAVVDSHIAYAMQMAEFEKQKVQLARSREPPAEWDPLWGELPTPAAGTGIGRRRWMSSRVRRGVFRCCPCFLVGCGSAGQ